jgi:hypothetical protein
MPALQHHTEFDPRQLAAAARSILSCPADVSLVVDGVDDLLADRDELGMSDDDGRPMLVCPTDSPFAEAAAARRSALLTVASGVGPAGASSRDAKLTLAGRLSVDGRNDCECCGEPRTQVSMMLNFVLLSRLVDDGRERQYRVPLDHFGSSDHRLNRGFLQRSVEHANQCHQEELRRAVAQTTGTPMVDVAGVRLDDLLPHRVKITWVDPEGARSRTVQFGREARSTEELGELLRARLHAGLC